MLKTFRVSNLGSAETRIQRRWTWGLVFLVLILFSIPTATSISIPDRIAPRLCYAFLVNGDLWTVCNGQRRKIDFGGKARDFAITFDGSSFVASSQKTAASQTEPPTELLIASLLKRNTRTATLPGALAPANFRASCGTIITIARDPGLKDRLGLVYDVVTNNLLNDASYKSMHCSDDRRIKVGWSNPDQPSLAISAKGSEQILKAAPWKDFDVSPSGKYVAYFREGENWKMEVCASEEGLSSSCAPDPGQAYMLGRMSISNSSEIIYESSADAGCYYKDREHYSEKHLKGYSLEDPCPSVLYWRPRLEKPQVLEKLGDHPQWITPEIAQSLQQWNASRAPSTQVK